MSTDPAAIPTPASVVWTAWRRTSTPGTAAGPARRGWKATAHTALTSMRWAHSWGVLAAPALLEQCGQIMLLLFRRVPKPERGLTVMPWGTSHSNGQDDVPEGEAYLFPCAAVRSCQPLLPWLQVHQHSPWLPLRALSPRLPGQHCLWCGGRLCQGQQAGE